MLRAITLRNVKRYGAEPQRFEIGRLTALLGPNCAGKSTLFQILLALKQSWRQLPDIHVLRTDGALVSMGTFANVIHRHLTERLLEVGFEFDDELRRTPDVVEESRPPLASTVVDLAFAALGDLHVGRLKSVRVRQGEIGAVFSDVRIEDDDDKKILVLTIDPCSVESLLHPDDDDESRMFFRDLDEVPCPWQEKDESPRKRALLGIRIEQARLSAFLENTKQRSAPTHVDPKQAAEWEKAEDAGRLRLARAAERLFDRPDALLRIRIEKLIGGTLVRLWHQLQMTSHIGPTRRQCSRIHHVAESEVTSVGRDGEHLEELLALRSDVVEEVNRDLQWMRIPYRVEVRDIATGTCRTVELTLVHTDEQMNGVAIGVSDVGFGVGQLLPVLAELARLRLDAPKETAASTGPLLLCEQPELHLHPRWQLELASALVGAPPKEVGAAPDLRFDTPQTIIETHSEHIVLRLQSLIRRDQLLPEDVVLLGVTIDYLTGSSRTKRICFGPDGSFEDEWPDGFFEERLMERYGGE